MYHTRPILGSSTRHGFECWPVLAIKHPASSFKMKQLHIDASHHINSIAVVCFRDATVTSKHVKGKPSKTKELCSTGSV